MGDLSTFNFVCELFKSSGPVRSIVVGLLLTSNNDVVGGTSLAGDEVVPEDGNC